jgi:RHS repeat-associated protein
MDPYSSMQLTHRTIEVEQTKIGMMSPYYAKTVGRDGSVVETAYDGLNNVCAVSNPSFNDPGPLSCPTNQTSCTGTAGVTSFCYDALGRKTQQTNPDNTAKTWSYNMSYSGDVVTFKDENLNQWLQTVDALGRLTNVVENDPTSGAMTINTGYTYDALNNLVCVDQWGSATPGTPCSKASSRSRTFTYDGLSRLIYATNPESGTVTYQYSFNGGTLCSGDPSNVCDKTDARNVTTTFAYDNLNRVVSKTYNDGTTPSVQFTYDTSSIAGSANTNGRLTSESTSLNGKMLTQRQLYFYNPLGWLQAEQQCTPGNCAGTPNTLNYTYNLAGDMITSSNGVSTAGENTQLSYGYDSAERLSQITSSWPVVAGHPSTLFCADSTGSNGCPAATQTTYDAAGHLTFAQMSISGGQAAMNMARTFDNRERSVTETVIGQGVAGMAASLSVTISGAEQSSGGSGTSSQATGTIVLSDANADAITSSGKIAGVHPLFLSDSITLPDGYHVTFVAGQGGALGVADSLAAVLNAATSPVTAVVSAGGTASGASVVLTAKASGTGENGPISLTLVGTPVTAAAASMSGGGGSNYDAGSVTANVAGSSVATSYGPGSTPQSVAQGLATAINGASLGVTASAGSAGALTITASQTGTAGNSIAVTLSSASSEPDLFTSPSFTGTSGTLAGGVDGTTGQIYGYAIPSPGGYDPNGNVLLYSDCFTVGSSTTFTCSSGTWAAITYDKLNRLTSATANDGPWNGLTLSWTYDAFGNRTAQTPIVSTPPPPTLTAPVPPAQTLSFTTNNNNRIDNYGTSGYDAAGNVLNDLVNQYVYDGEGRVCAVYNVDQGSTQYIYDAEGRRVAKGTIPNPVQPNPLNCSGSGYSQTGSYVLGQSGEHITELDGSGNFLRSHVYANGQLLATYSNAGTEFAFSDWLGTKRVVANADGTVTGGSAGTCISLLFGDELNCTGAVALNGHHFTSQIHDQESGNDYFGARYFASSSGRFLSPDPAGMMAADIEFPQSLNRYAYVWNNPLSFTDPTGLDCAYLDASGTGIEQGGLDQNSNAGECGENGGYWVDGGLTNLNIDSNNNTISLTGTTNGTDTTSASYQMQTTADVGWFINMPQVNPAGHIAIGIGGGPMWGLGPKNPLNYAIPGNRAYQVVPGNLEEQKGGQLKKMVHVPITGPQAAILQQQIQSGQVLPPDYTLYGPRPACDCATWGQQILGDAGINTGPAEPRPESFIEQLDMITPRQQ